MSVLSYTEICELIEAGIIENADYDCVNSASLDIHMGTIVLSELPDSSESRSLDKKDQLQLHRVDLSINPNMRFIMQPGEFVLTQSREIFNLPYNVSAEYKLKSSMARLGLEHLNAGWCDAGWHGSVLTLELKNMTRYHRISLKPGVRIGQMVFFRHNAVPADKSYAVRGSYNQDKEAKGVKVS